MAARIELLRAPWAAKVAGIARQWAQSGAFSPAKLLLNARGPLTVKSSTCNSFMYAEMPNPVMLPDYEPAPNLTQLSPAEFVDRLQDSGSDYLYFTQPMAKLAPEYLETHAANWRDLVPKLVDNPRGITPYLAAWIGTEGATTQAHYDVANNVFVQVYGRKLFKIYPPSAVHAMHVFPDAHPRARKSQLDFKEINHAVFPYAHTLPPPIEITLDEGEALFIPAFWFHHVTALTPSVSLNVFFESCVRMAAESIFQTPPPLDYKWNSEQMRSGYTAAATELCTHADISDARLFIHQILQSRYDPLYLQNRYDTPTDRSSAPESADNPSQVPSVDLSFIAEAAASYATKFDALRSAADEEGHNDYDGLRDIMAAHLLELYAVNLWRAKGVYGNMSACFGHNVV